MDNDKDLIFNSNVGGVKLENVLDFVGERNKVVLFSGGDDVVVGIGELVEAKGGGREALEL